MEQEYLLHKYLNGEATQEEIEQLKSSTEFSSYLKIAESTKTFTTPEHDSQANFEVILDGIKHSKKQRQPQWMSHALKIAALLVLLLVGYVFINSLDTTVSTSIAQKEVVQLPDNSVVTLNAQSKLSYNKSDWSTARTLTLQGEAHFDVMKGSRFSVTTSIGIVTVLGTEFNIFVRNDVFNVQCFEGLVEVSFAGERIQLAAGQQLQIENGLVIDQNTTQLLIPGWMGKESVFDNAKLVTVLKEIENQYEINLNWPPNIEQRRFSGSFTHADLEKALQSVCTPLQLTHQIEGKQVNIYDAKDK